MAIDAPREPPPPERTAERMQRMRVGLTGLAAILLIVALATAIATGIGRDLAPANQADTAITGNLAVEDSNATDPLAELGVAPAPEAPPKR